MVAFSFLLLLSAARAQPGVDAAALIAEAAENARSAATWVAEGITTVRRPGQPEHSMNFELRYRQASAATARLNLMGHSALMARVCDGASQWFWYRGTKTYAGTSSPHIGPCASAPRMAGAFGNAALACCHRTSPG
jgi:hypothetical protein